MAILLAYSVADTQQGLSHSGLIQKLQLFFCSASFKITRNFILNKVDKYTVEYTDNKTFASLM
jgi:hypothetical protein